MPKVNGRDIFETKPWLNDDPQNIEQYSGMVSASAPSGTIEISANGEYDVSEYATADVQVEGGGGSSDFSTATMTVTYVVTDPPTFLTAIVPIIYAEDDLPFPIISNSIGGDTGTENYDAVLYLGKTVLQVDPGVYLVSMDGNIQYDNEMEWYVITGDCSFTITDAEPTP